MTARANEARDTHVRIGAVTIVAGSAIDARRLTDALPAALARAMALPPGQSVARPSLADRAARDIVARIDAARERAL